ncbi:hypothetical protein BS78_01G376600 [Paspalum vaginatum]|nr:hypothetical protein BS78_01G376600 [Paspalum vaginatum]
MECLVGQVDLLPPRRSTLRDAASPPSAAVLTTAQARNDVEALGWAECPIACVAAFAAPSVDAPEPVEPVPRPADSVLAGRRPRSKRTRGSAYGPGDVPASKAVKAAAPPQKAKVIVKVEERDRELVSPPPPPPLWMRSPTPPPPPSPPPPPPCWPQPTMAPIPAPPAWGTPTVLPQPSQLFWGLPLPTLPAAPPCHGMSPLPESAPGWIASVPPSYPAPFWGAPSALPPLPPHVLFCRPPTTAPHWGSMLSPTAHPLMQLQRPPPPTSPPLLQLLRPPPNLLGHQPPPALPQAPPTPMQQCHQPPHFRGQHPPPPLDDSTGHRHLPCSCTGRRRFSMGSGHLQRFLKHHHLQPPCSCRAPAEGSSWGIPV